MSEKTTLTSEDWTRAGSVKIDQGRTQHNVTVYATSVSNGRLVNATVSSAGIKGYEQVVITNRNGAELLVDRDALHTLIAALQQVQAALNR